VHLGESDLDDQFSATDFLSIDGIKSLLLGVLAFEFDESETLGATTLASYNGCFLDVEFVVGEDLGEADVIHLEWQVGHEQHSLGFSARHIGLHASTATSTSRTTTNSSKSG